MTTYTELTRGLVSAPCPTGWNQEQDAEAVFGHRSAQGPEATSADGALNAWSEWRQDVGVLVMLDTDDTGLYTVDEIRAFHGALGKMLNQIESATGMRPVAPALGRG